MTDLSADERRVLKWLWKNAGLDYCFAFSPIANGTGFSIDETRMICRSLTSKGLLYFSRGLVDESFKPAGSGYGCTPRAGDAMADPSP